MDLILKLCECFTQLLENKFKTQWREKSLITKKQNHTHDHIHQGEDMTHGEEFSQIPFKQHWLFIPASRCLKVERLQNDFSHFH